jgi:hypothetical protein
MNSEEIPMNNDSTINVKIRTLDNEFKVKIKKEDKIMQLKEKIETVKYNKFIILDSKSSN